MKNRRARRRPQDRDLPLLVAGSGVSHRTSQAGPQLQRAHYSQRAVHLRVSNESINNRPTLVKRRGSDRDDREGRLLHGPLSPAYGGDGSGDVAYGGADGVGQ